MELKTGKWFGPNGYLDKWGDDLTPLTNDEDDPVHVYFQRDARTFVGEEQFVVGVFNLSYGKITRIFHIPDKDRFACPFRAYQGVDTTDKRGGGHFPPFYHPSRQPAI